MEKTTDVIIPTYRPGKEFGRLIERLQKQSCPIHRIIIMNTEEKFWNKEWDEKYPFLEVHHIPKAEFDHGGTRKKAAALSEADIMVFMTQDALPADGELIQNLTGALCSDEQIGAAYARQLPNAECSFVERYTRSFNYPEISCVKTKADLPRYGIKTYFCSNVCAAYKKDIFEKLGGFVERTIFNEDMILAGTMIKQGGKIAYCAKAKVIHSHNYSAFQQFHRNFDLAVSQTMYPEVFGGIRSESEGIKLVKKSLSYCIKIGKPWLMIQVVTQSAGKFLGYKMGQQYRSLSMWLILRCTMSPSFWRGGKA